MQFRAQNAVSWDCQGPTVSEQEICEERCRSLKVVQIYETKCVSLLKAIKQSRTAENDLFNFLSLGVLNMYNCVFPSLRMQAYFQEISKFNQ